MWSSFWSPSQGVKAVFMHQWEVWRLFWCTISGVRVVLISQLRCESGYNALTKILALTLTQMSEWHLKYYVCIWWMDMFPRSACMVCLVFSQTWKCCNLQKNNSQNLKQENQLVRLEAEEESNTCTHETNQMTGKIGIQSA